MHKLGRNIDRFLKKKKKQFFTESNITLIVLDQSNRSKNWTEKSSTPNSSAMCNFYCIKYCIEIFMLMIPILLYMRSKELLSCKKQEKKILFMKRLDYYSILFSHYATIDIPRDITDRSTISRHLVDSYSSSVISVN